MQQTQRSVQMGIWAFTWATGRETQDQEGRETVSGASYYSRFVLNYLDVTSLLTDLTKKGT